VLRDGTRQQRQSASAISGRSRLTCCCNICRVNRWFAGKDTAIASTAIQPLRHASSGKGATTLLTFVDVTLRDGRQQRYFLPLSGTLGAKSAAAGRDAQIAPFTLCQSSGKDRGSVPSSIPPPTSRSAMASSVPMAAGERSRSAWRQAALQLQPRDPRSLAELPEGAPVRSVGVEQSNSAVIIGERILLKIYRQPESGVSNPSSRSAAT
jgi:hypothetical protein